MPLCIRAVKCLLFAIGLRRSGNGIHLIDLVGIIYQHRWHEALSLWGVETTRHQRVVELIIWFRAKLRFASRQWETSLQSGLKQRISSTIYMTLQSVLWLLMTLYHCEYRGWHLLDLCHCWTKYHQQRVSHCFLQWKYNVLVRKSPSLTPPPPPPHPPPPHTHTHKHTHT